MTIRKATYNDLPAITEIYNHAIEHTTSTFDTILKTAADRKVWLDEHSELHPVLVMEVQESVIGWASLSRWSPRAAYDGTVEVSIYLAPGAQGKGYGNTLLKAIIEAGKQAGLHTIIARTTSENKISIRLHEKNGFVSKGTLTEVGYKFGRYLDVEVMQLMLK